MSVSSMAIENSGTPLPTVVIGHKIHLVDLWKSVVDELKAFGTYATPLLFSNKEPLNHIKLTYSFEGKPNAPNLFFCPIDECVGVNFFKVCHVVMLDWPQTLAAFHQAVGRSNRVDPLGKLYVSFPEENDGDFNLEYQYQMLENNHTLGK